jgi:hypothetical protein
VVFTPHATLYHHERATRGRSITNANLRDDDLARRKWGDFSTLRDEFYNENFDRFQPFHLKL